MDVPLVSLCMIVRNEERRIADCLHSALGLFDEIVIVDTGSTDATVSVAKECGANVETVRWPDSFAIARNESLDRATGKWIFWLDADDRLDAANRERENSKGTFMFSNDLSRRFR